MKAALFAVCSLWALLGSAYAHTYYEIADSDSSLEAAGGVFSAYTHTYNKESGDGPNLVWNLTLPAGATGASIRNFQPDGPELLVLVPTRAALTAPTNFTGNSTKADITGDVADIAELVDHIDMGHILLVADMASGEALWGYIGERPSGHSSYAPAGAPTAAPSSPSSHAGHAAPAPESITPTVTASSGLTSAAAPAASLQAGILGMSAALLAGLALLA